jgi:hypothetical protein
LVKEASDALRASEHNNPDARRCKVDAASRSQRFDCDLIALALNDHYHAHIGRIGPPIHGPPPYAHNSVTATQPLGDRDVEEDPPGRDQPRVDPQRLLGLRSRLSVIVGGEMDPGPQRAGPLVPGALSQ